MSLHPWSRYALCFAILSALLGITPITAAEELQVERNEFTVGESVRLKIPGGINLLKPKWSANPKGIVSFQSKDRSEAVVEGIAPGRVTVSVRVKKLLGGDTSHAANLTVRPASLGSRSISSQTAKPQSASSSQSRSMPDASRIQQINDLMQRYDAELGSIRSLFDKQANPNRTPGMGELTERRLSQITEKFFHELGDMGLGMRDLQQFKDQYKTVAADGHPLFPGQGTWDDHFLGTERALMMGRAQLVQRLWMETLQDTFRANPDAAVFGEIDIGSWVKMRLGDLGFQADIDFSSAAIDPELNRSIVERFEGKLRRHTSLDMVRADALLTPHGQATADVFIGDWGKTFAELDMLKRSKWKVIKVEKNPDGSLVLDENGQPKIRMVEKPGTQLFWEVAFRKLEAGQFAEVDFPKMDLAKEPMLSLEMLRHGIHDIEHGPYSRGQKLIKMLKYAERSYFMSKKAVAEFGFNPYAANDPLLAQAAEKIIANKNDPEKVSDLLRALSGEEITANNVDAVTDKLVARAKTAMHDNAARALAFRLNAIARIDADATRQKAAEKLWSDLGSELGTFRNTAGDPPRIMVEAQDMAKAVMEGKLPPAELEAKANDLHRLLNEAYKLPDSVIDRLLMSDSVLKLKAYLRKLGWIEKAIDDFTSKAKQKFPNMANFHAKVMELNQQLEKTTAGSGLLKAADWADNAFNVYEAYLNSNASDALLNASIAMGRIGAQSYIPSLQIPFALYDSLKSGSPKPLGMAVAFMYFPFAGQTYMVSGLMQRADVGMRDAEFYDALNKVLDITEFDTQGKITGFRLRNLIGKEIDSESISPPGNRQAIVDLFTKPGSTFYTSPNFRYWSSLVPRQDDRFGRYGNKLENLRRFFGLSEDVRYMTVMLENFKAKSDAMPQDRYTAQRQAALEKMEAQLTEAIWMAMADMLESSARSVNVAALEARVKKFEDELNLSDIDLGRNKALTARIKQEIRQNSSLLSGENPYAVALIYDRYIKAYEQVAALRKQIVLEVWSSGFGIDYVAAQGKPMKVLLLGGKIGAPALSGDPDKDVELAEKTLAAHRVRAENLRADLATALGRALDPVGDKDHLKTLGQIGLEWEHLLDDCADRAAPNCEASVRSALQQRVKLYKDYLAKLEGELAEGNEKKAAADRLWQEGTKHFDQKEWTEALGKFKESLTYVHNEKRTKYVADLEATYAQAQKLKEEGTSLEKQNKSPEAIDHYKRSLKVWPDKTLEEHVKELEAEQTKGGLPGGQEDVPQKTPAKPVQEPDQDQQGTAEDKADTKGEPKDAPTCIFTYTNWEECNPKTQKKIRSIKSKKPEGCTEREKAILEQNCTPTPEAKTDNKTVKNDGVWFKSSLPGGWEIERNKSGDWRAALPQQEFAPGIKERCPPLNKSGAVTAKFVGWSTRFKPGFKPEEIDEELRKYVKGINYYIATEDGIQDLTIGEYTGRFITTNIDHRDGFGSPIAGFLGGSAYSYGYAILLKKNAPGDSYSGIPMITIEFRVSAGYCWDKSGKEKALAQTASMRAQAIKISNNLSIHENKQESGIKTPEDIETLEVSLDHTCPIQLPFLETITLKVNIQGGQAPYTIQWSGEGTAKDGEFIFAQSFNPGTFKISVTVIDNDGTFATTQCQVIVNAISVEIEKTNPAENTFLVGSKATFRAMIKSGEHQVDGDFLFHWQSDPKVLFGTNETALYETQEGAITATYTYPARYDMWVKLLKKNGNTYETIGESNRLQIEVVNPELSLTADKADPLIGEKVLIKVQEKPAMRDDLITFWWELKGEANNPGPEPNVPNRRAYSFKPKTDKPVTVIVHARSTEDGSDLGRTEIVINPKKFTITIDEPRYLGPKPRIWKCDTQLDGDCPGLVEVGNQQFAVFHDVFMKARVSPSLANARYQWSIEPQGICGLPSSAGEIKINCSRTGTFTVYLKVFNSDGDTVGATSRSVTIGVSQEDLGGAQKSKEAHEKINEAKKLIAEGKLDEGIVLVNEAASLDPKNTEAKNLGKRLEMERTAIQEHLDKARAQISANMFDKAEKETALAEKLHPKYVPLVEMKKLLGTKRAEYKEKLVDGIAKAKGFLKQGKLDEAIQEVLAAAKFAPQNKEADNLVSQLTKQKEQILNHLDKSKKHVETDKFEEAEKEWKLAQKIQPQYGPVIETEKFIKTKKEGLKKNIGDKLIKAKEFAKQGNLDDAISLADAAAALDPKNTEARNLSKRLNDERTTVRQLIDRAAKALQKNRPDDAQKELDAAKKLHPRCQPVTDMEKQISDQRKTLSSSDIGTSSDTGSSRANDPAGAASAAQPVNLVGRWKSSEGDLFLAQSGSSITGSYSSDGGEIVGEMNGNVLEGYWIENSSKERCASAKNGRHHWGRIRWVFDGKKFSGTWSYCDKPVASGGGWTGERIGDLPPGYTPPVRTTAGSASVAMPNSAAVARPSQVGDSVGTWTLNANGHPGKLEISVQSGHLSARLRFDGNSRWEDLRDVRLDGNTLLFTRPIQGATQRYAGTLDGNELRGTFKQENTWKLYNWSASKSSVADTRGLASTPAPADTGSPAGSALAGTWAIDANGFKGKLEVTETGGRLSGRVWFDAHKIWEDLRDFSFDGRTLRFLRPGPGQRYTGTLAGDAVRGSFDQGGAGSWNWSLVRTAAATPSPTPTTTPRMLAFTWLGMDEDRVGEWGNGKPNGTLDGHFRLTLEAPDRFSLTSLSLWSANEKGEKTGGQIWHTRNGGNWMLGVFRDGRQLNTSHVTSLGEFSGRVVLDLYANSSGWFKPGQWFLLEVEDAGGKVTRQTLRLDALPVPAGGRDYTGHGSPLATADGRSGTGYLRIEACVDGSDWIGIESGLLVHRHRAFDQIGTHGGCPATHRVAGGGFLVDGLPVALTRLPMLVGMAGIGRFEVERGRGQVRLDGANRILIDDDGPGGADLYIIRLYPSATTSGTPPVTIVPAGRDYTAAPVQDQLIFELGNIGGVGNGPSKVTHFTLAAPHVITLIRNYHWNSARGAAPGSIALKGKDGVNYGPWQATGSPGQDGVPNANWTVYPQVPQLIQ